MSTGAAAVRSSSRIIDLSAIGLGQQSWATAILVLLARHMGTETGEIAVLRELQGATGYPFKD